MMIKWRHAFMFVCCALFSLCVSAQEGSTRQIYAQAEDDYGIGRFQQVIDLLNEHMNEFRGRELQNVYRMMALCYLAQDDMQNTEYYASQLLKENPYYTSALDPLRFENMIERMKAKHISTITTASSKEESVSEAPVPVTIITREMIDNVGYNKTLNNILSIYVPGFSEIIASTMDNISVHGVYTSGQEKILVMENGHRLNARSTNIGKMDYCISTEKIDHIEVLRGPASSLYGNVALTAVVNIITRRGADANGIKVKYGFGENHTHRADIIYGNTFSEANIFAWGNIYSSNGKSVITPIGSGYNNNGKDGEVFMGRYDGKPSYDCGAQLEIKDFSVMLSRKYSKQVPQYTLYGENYDFERYRSINGQTPGFSVGSSHLDLSYKKQLGTVNINTSVNGDWYHIADYSVLSDSILFTRYQTNGTPAKNADGTPIREIQKGLYQKTDWNEYTIGAILKVDVPYNIVGMKGDLLIGAQHEYFSLTSTDYYLGENYDQVELVMPESLNAIDVGHERVTSFFLQDKHYFTKSIIANIGLRYDRKHRKNDKIINAFSPRVALIYTPTTKFNVKLSYSRAFVDAPYFYRQNKTNTYSGGENLMPEYMNALQLDFMGWLDNNRFVYDVNFFFNRLTDIINNTQKVGEHTSAKYRNSGHLTTWGTELVLGYNTNTFNAHVSTTYQHVISSEDYYVENGNIYAVPSFVTNMTLSKRLFKLGKHSLHAMTTLSYISKTYHKINERHQPVEPIISYDGRFLIDLGLKYKYHNILQLSADVENLLNKTYYVGGTTNFPYQHLGRFAMATLAFNL